MVVGGFVLGSLILYLKGMRRMMFQLSGFYCRGKLVNELGKGTLQSWICIPKGPTDPIIRYLGFG